MSEDQEEIAPKRRGRPPKVASETPETPSETKPKSEEVPTGLTLCEFLPRVSPKFHAPTHFPELIDALEGVVHKKILKPDILIPLNVTSDCLD